MTSHQDAVTSVAPRTWCERCGARFNRAHTAITHHCPPNDTGFNPGETVRVGQSTGQVTRVDRGSVEVYFRSSYRAQWYPASQLERVAA